MRLKDRACGIFMFVLALVLYIYIPYEVPRQTVGVLGPDVFPRTVAIMMMLGSAWLFYSSFRKDDYYTDDHATTTPEEKKAYQIGELRVILAIVLLVSYAFLIDIIGFIGASLVSGTGVFLLLKNKKWWMYLIFVGFILLVYYIFKHLLYIQLP